MAADVTIEISDRVALLTVSNPRRRNVLDLDMSARLVAALDTVVADDGVGAVVITGAPPAFCAGGDLGELADADEAVLRAVYAGFLAVAHCPLPTVAAVNGPAVGAGLNLALACDVRLAGPTARFDARFLQLGLHPGGGYTWMVRRALGAQGAAALTLFSEVLDAAEAERVGLVWRHHPDDVALLAAAHTLAARAAATDRALAVTTKSTLRLAAGATHAETTEVELRAQAASLRSENFRTRLAKWRKLISSR